MSLTGSALVERSFAVVSRGRWLTLATRQFGAIRWTWAALAVAFCWPGFVQGQISRLPAVESVPLGPVRPVAFLQPAPPSPADLSPPQPPDVLMAETNVAGAMSLPELEQMALANNPAVAQAAAQVEALQGHWVQVGLLPNPNLGYSGQQLGSGGRSEQHGVFIGQQLVIGGKLRLNRAVASQEVAAAEQVYAAARQRVLTDVSAGYYEMLASQRRLELSQQLLEISQQAVHTVDMLMKAQEASRVDLLQAQIEVQSARISLNVAQNQYQAAWRRLAAVLGTPNLAPRPLAGRLTDKHPEIVWDEALLRLQNESPELAAAWAEVERSRWALRRAYAERIPNLDVQAIVQRDNDISGTDGALQATMPIPILNRNQGGIRQAEGELIAAERAVERVQLDLQRRLAAVYQRFDSARFQAENYSREILPAAKSSLELATTGFKAGEISFLSLLTAQRTYFQTNLDYIESLRELWAATVEIEGLLLSESLSER